MLRQIIFILLVMPSDLYRIKAARKSHRSKRDTAVVQSCSSMVYCQGDLLDTIQRFKLYVDSKTFVDMVQINPESVTLENFNSLMKSTNNTPTETDVSKFVTENFISEDESDTWIPTDLNESPEFLNRIRDRKIRTFAKALVGIWGKLGRRVKEKVSRDSSQHSLIPVPEGFVVPGGRFREIYYWDSYWIIKGLLISEMKTTVKGMLENFIFLIKTYGLIPNGSRIYYLNRSQPPLFTAMVGLYIDYTNDTNWLKDNIDYIEQELLWWINKRTVTITTNGVDYQLAHYGPESNTPRPESYAEDLTTCSYFKTDDEQKKCYSALKTGAESGWDFSTRWIFNTENSTSPALTNIDAKRVIPVDLNALLCQSFKILSEFYSKVGNKTKEATWADYAKKWLNNMETLLYNEADGIWYDYDRVLLQQRKLFFPSNFVPLWADCYNLTKKDEYGKKAAKYIYDQEIDNFLGGVPTSLDQSGEQWDMPNAWPPLQEFVILGLYKTDNTDAKNIAEKFANRWIAANIKGFAESGEMYEKYDAVEPGKYGGGGEYNVQLGFGWSNGVALSLIHQFNSARISKVILNPFLYIVVLSLLMSMR